MAFRTSHLIEVNPVARLYRVKQLVSFPGISEILFLFQRAKSDEQPSAKPAQPSDSEADKAKEISAGT